MYGLTLDNQKLIIDKAKTKSDGVYRFRGVMYRVVDSKAVLYAYDKQILQSAFGFNCVIGSYEYGILDSELKKILKNITL